MAPLPTSITTTNMSSTVATPTIVNNSASNIPEDQINLTALIMVLLTGLMLLSAIFMISLSIAIITLRRHHNSCNNKTRETDIESVKPPNIEPLNVCLLTSILVCPFFLASTLSPLRTFLIEQLEKTRGGDNTLLNLESVTETHTVGLERTYGTLATSHKQ